MIPAFGGSDTKLVFDASQSKLGEAVKAIDPTGKVALGSAGVAADHAVGRLFAGVRDNDPQAIQDAKHAGAAALKDALSAIPVIGKAGIITHIPGLGGNSVKPEKPAASAPSVSRVIESAHLLSKI